MVDNLTRRILSLSDFLISRKNLPRPKALNFYDFLNNFPQIDSLINNKYRQYFLGEVVENLNDLSIYPNFNPLDLVLFSRTKNGSLNVIRPYSMEQIEENIRNNCYVFSSEYKGVSNKLIRPILVVIK